MKNAASLAPHPPYKISVFSAYRLVKTTSSKVVGDDDVGDRVKDKLHVLGVGGAGHVTVDLLGGRLVLGLELGLDVGGSLAVLLRTCSKKVWLLQGLN